MDDKAGRGAQLVGRLFEAFFTTAAVDGRSQNARVVQDRAHGGETRCARPVGRGGVHV
jgi:hypothetical protein